MICIWKRKNKDIFIIRNGGIVVKNFFAYKIDEIEESFFWKRLSEWPIFTRFCANGNDLFFRRGNERDETAWNEGNERLAWEKRFLNFCHCIDCSIASLYGLFLTCYNGSTVEKLLLIIEKSWIYIDTIRVLYPFWRSSSCRRTASSRSFGLPIQTP